MERACQLLDALTGGPLPLAEVARRCDLHRSSAFRLLGALEQAGLVEQEPDKRYRLGLQAIVLGRAALAHRGVVSVARPHLSRLVQRVQESASLTLFEDGRAYYVDGVESARSMRARPYLAGSRVPLHSTAAGKVLLASLPDEELSTALRSLSYERLTPRTITSPDLLRREVLRVRDQGYAVDDQELETGLICIAAPLRDRDSRVVGAVSISGHCVRLEEYGVERAAADVRATAREISLDLGESDEAKEILIDRANEGVSR